MITVITMYRKEILAALILCSVGFGGMVLFSSSSLPLEKKGLAAVEEAIILPDDPFDDLLLEARAAYVLDSVKNEVFYAKNEEAQLPLASLTKLMTAFTASLVLPSDATVIISEEAIATEGDSGLVSGDPWGVFDLIGFTLIVSSNDGAAAIGNAAGAGGSADSDDFLKNKERFVGMMNEKAKELGLSQTYFTNETGLDAHEYASGSYGSAHDVTRLMDHILKTAPSLLMPTQYAEYTFYSKNLVYTSKNTNSALPGIPALLGSKTGFTNLAGGNLVVAYDAGIGHPIIITVLGSTEQGRFRDVIKLVEASLLKVAQ